VVSHDRWFLDKIATGILAFEGDGKVVFHEGDYSTYAARRVKALRDAAANAPTSDAPRPERTRAPAAKKLSFKDARELEAMEAQIGIAEAKVSELEKTLEDPALYKERAAEVATIVADLETARSEVERLYHRWQELESLAMLASIRS